ncbi:MAG TPA: SANT/Myb-like DNA-binding domain-containing protein [Candidatus Deferrimicrobiaceae bacterium]|nr:SANT/Myb-like DNA-binding domain-containing protein [Candidatus Deferrimicrobiaceae bacterium]
MRGKSWSVEEEKWLRELIGEGLGIDRISKVMGKTRVSVMSKMYHLGLALVDAGTAPPPPASSPASSSTPHQTGNQALNNGPSVSSTTVLNPVVALAAAPASEVDASAAQLKEDGPLPSIEEQLHVLNAAIVALRRPGISRVEVARYSKIIDGVKVYNDLFAKFVDYRGLEIKVLELEKQLASEKSP